MRNSADAHAGLGTKYLPLQRTHRGIRCKEEGRRWASSVKRDNSYERRFDDCSQGLFIAPPSAALLPGCQIACIPPDLSSLWELPADAIKAANGLDKSAMGACVAT